MNGFKDHEHPRSADGKFSEKPKGAAPGASHVKAAARATTEPMTRKVVAHGPFARREDIDSYLRLNPDAGPLYTVFGSDGPIDPRFLSDALVELSFRPGESPSEISGVFISAYDQGTHDLTYFNDEGDIPPTTVKAASLRSVYVIEGAGDLSDRDAIVEVDGSALDVGAQITPVDGAFRSGTLGVALGGVDPGERVSVATDEWYEAVAEAELVQGGGGFELELRAGEPWDTQGNNSAILVGDLRALVAAADGVAVDGVPVFVATSEGRFAVGDLAAPFDGNGPQSVVLFPAR